MLFRSPFLIECDQNFAIDFYNLAKQYYKKGQKDSTCFYLNLAARFDSLDNDIQLARQLLCNIKRTNLNLMFEQDYEPYREKGLYGYRRIKTKETLIRPQYQEINLFSDGLASVKVNSK